MTYRYLPSTSELLDFLKVKREFVALDRWVRIAGWISVTGFFVVLACGGLHYLKWFDAKVLKWTALIAFAILIAAVFAIAALGVARNFEILQTIWRHK